MPKKQQNSTDIDKRLQLIRADSVGGTNLEYDAAGNLAKDADGYEYEYDYENRIVKITKDPNDTVVAQFAYDNLDRLTVAEYSISDNNELFTYDDLGNRTNVNIKDGSNLYLAFAFDWMQIRSAGCK